MPHPRKELKLFSSLQENCSAKHLPECLELVSKQPKTSKATLQVQPGSFVNLPQRHFAHFIHTQLTEVLEIITV